MKFIVLFFLLTNLFFLYSCGLNTKFDDSEYRPVGASSPLNSNTHTLSETQKVAIEHEEETESSSTRFIKPNSESITKNKKTENNDIGKINSRTKKPVSKSIAKKNQKNDTITTTIREVFISRYGNSETILKISKTVLLHCEDKPYKQSTVSKTSICQYQFPNICGAHRFSVISNENKQLLIFIDKKYQRNIIDTLAGEYQSTPGLWDEDDYVSSELLTVRQLLNNKAEGSDSLGWIVSVDKNEKAQLGRSYYSAINESSKCF